MQSPSKRFAPLSALVLGFSLAVILNGCLVDFHGKSNPPPYTILSARWAVQDSLLIYSVRDDMDTSTVKRYRVRIFAAVVDSSHQVSGNSLVFSVEGEGCYDLTVRDSLVYMTYYPHEAEPKWGCEQSANGPNLLVGHWGHNPMFPVGAPVDTATLRTSFQSSFMSRDPGLYERGGLESYFTLCIEDGPCLEDIVKVWNDSSGAN